MNTRHRSFQSNRRKEPVTFDVDSEEITCVAHLPSGLLLDVATELMGDGNMNPGALSDFFDAVIVEDDRERFAKLLRKPDGPDLDTLRDITQFLVEEYTGFPTQTSSGLQQQPSASRGSQGGSRSRGSGSKSSQRRRS